MTKNVQAFEAYGTEFRFKKAIEIEKELETNCDVAKCNKQPIFCSKFCAEVEKDVEKEVLEQIREAFQTVRILQLLATPKKQKQFSDYFFMNFFTRQDMYNDYVYNESLKKNYNVMSKIEEMPNAESEIQEMPNAESEIQEMPNAEPNIEEMPNAEAKIEEMPKGCAATKKVVSAANWWCHACDDGDQADDASSRSACIEAINCAICTPFCLTTMAVGCIFSVPIDTVNGICACIGNAKTKKKD
uniref:Uncharacterized protein n=1 Tax=Globodera rostochiensis TaxID=31243 RepID=A0A914HKW9_GLORO